MEKPLEYYENNVSGTLTLLRVMRKYGCRTMIFSSSATVYGSQNPVPYREEMPTSATNPYGYTKVMIEQILRDVCAADPNFTAVALRYFNPIGAHMSGLLGENPNGIPNNLVPYVAQVASGKLDHVQVYGDDYDTPDGTGVRDYIHVMDLAVGHVAALAYGANHHGFEAVNLGTGHGSSVLEVIHAMRKPAAERFPWRSPTPCRRRCRFLCGCLQGEGTGWAGRHRADLQQMCSDSWRFTLQNPNGL